MIKNEHQTRTAEFLVSRGVTDPNVDYIDDGLMAHVAVARRGTREEMMGLLNRDVAADAVFDDNASYMVDNGDGTVTFNFRCAQDPFTIDKDKIVSLDVIGVCGTSSLYHLIYNY